MLKYSVAFVFNNQFDSKVQHMPLESELPLNMNNPRDRDFILKRLKGEYQTTKIRLIGVRLESRSKLDFIK